ncbi:hypothetical protein K227x_16310 [Rubripirellula lacrimiformis]|uniref:Uncharacterized protein n=1 Tax=Rubripirellula lacrimiformis TaxID=1930273 RepID=A0A517N7Y1_9BACT|nr:hypothetical protein K227x_16310 [Rubripirellula lacrimiformis]
MPAPIEPNAQACGQDGEPGHVVANSPIGSESRQRLSDRVSRDRVSGRESPQCQWPHGQRLTRVAESCPIE